MTNRRTFIKNSTGIMLGGMMMGLPARGLSFIKYPIPAPGLQLYTLGGLMDEDLDGTLKKVSTIGYKNIESAFSKKGGFYGLKPKEFASKISSLGMKWRSHHVIGAPFKPFKGQDGKMIELPPMKNLRENMQEIVDDVAAGGIPYLVCPFTPIETMDEIKESSETLVSTGEACKKAGIIFAFHNHTKEFELVDGQKPMDIFLSEIPADIMKIELDLGWAVKAGADPVALFKANPGRFPLWHAKDIKDEKPAEVGTGKVDFKNIFAHAQIAGLKYYFVEQDAAPSPIENITTSITNLKKLL
ncbi:MAG: sugar phosphate isomerase/epimerase [Chryseolinea sp.]